MRQLSHFGSNLTLPSWDPVRYELWMHNYWAEHKEEIQQLILENAHSKDEFEW